MNSTISQLCKSSNYNKIIETLPRGGDNLKNVKIKFSMSKPVLVNL